MSAYGTKRNSRRRLAMSAFGGKADMTRGRSAKKNGPPSPHWAWQNALRLVSTNRLFISELTTTICKS
jgi:hypothetical protein